MRNAARKWLLVCLLSVLPAQAARAADAVSGCQAHIAQWLDPASGDVIDGRGLFERLAASRIVLLGEAHTAAAHHRWQHYVLAALHSRNPNLALGFEMLPRRAQPVLDDWSAGRLGVADFLERSQWRKVWGYDPDLYLPLLHFARQNRLPALALNVDRELVSRVGEKGWAAVAASERTGLSDPAPASDEYRDSLASLYAYKMTLGQAEGSAADPGQIRDSQAFSHFVDAQLTWDRAMAEALAAAHRRDPRALVVGIVGRGHIEYGYGIPHQLADMGIDDVEVLLPLDADADCAALPAELASAVFVVEAEDDDTAAPKPRLGVLIEDDEDGVRVMQVVEDSIAERSGIREGDRIQSAAGFSTRNSADLIEIIQRQAPGTWLPITVKRGSKTVEITARFPQSFE